MLQEANQPSLSDFIEERSDVSVQDEAHLLAVDPDAERIQRIVRATPRPEPIRDAEELFLVDRVQQRDNSPLDDLVLQGSDRERALPAIRLGYVDPPARPRPIRSALDPVVQIFEIALKVCLVILPHQPVHSRCRVKYLISPEKKHTSRRFPAAGYARPSAPTIGGTTNA